MQRFRTRKANTYCSPHHGNRLQKLARTAVLVIDAQRRYTDPAFKERGSLKTHRVTQKIVKFLPLVRHLGIPVYFAYLYREYEQEKANQPHQCCGGFHLVSPLPEDVLVPKTGASVITSSDMASRLLDAGYRKLIMVGFNSSACIKFSALDAQKRGFEVTVLEDLVENDKGNNKPKMVRLKTLRQKGISVRPSHMFSSPTAFLK